MNFDALGLGALIGSLLFLAALLWVIIDNRSFEDLNRSTTSERPPAPAIQDPGFALGVEPSAASERPGEDPDPRLPTRPGGPSAPRRPSHSRRAA